MSYPSYVNPQALSMFNVSTLLNQKDSRWLQLEVCREYQRQKCTRSDCECKFAHPPPNVEVQNGRVTACYDSIKGRCNREKPACKYFHPPQHLKDQLLINGRNHLALKNALAQQMQQQIIPGQLPAVFGAPYMGASVPLTYSPYLPGLVSPLVAGGVQDQVGMLSPASVQPQSQQQQQSTVTQQQQQLQGKQRTDRLEALPANGVMPYKRTASDKSGLPVYQPVQAGPGPQQLGAPPQQQQQQQATATYHQILQMQQQPNLGPVSYGSGGQPISIPRYQ